MSDMFSNYVSTNPVVGPALSVDEDSEPPAAGGVVPLGVAPVALGAAIPVPVPAPAPAVIGDAVATCSDITALKRTLTTAYHILADRFATTE
jgi:hypothetical protein